MRATLQAVAAVTFLLAGVAAPIGPAGAAVEGFDVSELVPGLLPSVVSISMWHYVPALDDSGKPRADGAMARKPGVGTGYITDASGVIVTNRHVTDGAEEIFVTLYDGTRLQAALIYRSPDIDMAVLRVRPNAPLKPITWGDSDRMLPGTTVIPIGNPLGLGFTVTHGMVSARDRDIKETDLDSFMQVDAPINPGNSGGPLFNIHGEVIGMNTALFTAGGDGGSVGLNFAIPGNDVQFVLNNLKEHGRVRRGTTGAALQDLNQDMADAVGLARPEGALISFVPAGSPAAAAQLRAGDVVLEAAGRPIPNIRALRRGIAAVDIGETVPFVVLRGGARLTIPVTVAETPSDPSNTLMPGAQPTPRMLRPDLGLSGEPVTDANRARYGVPGGIQGIVVTDVMANSTAADLGLTRGIVLLRVNDTELTSHAALLDAIGRARAAGRPTVLVQVLDATGIHWTALPVPPPG